MRVGGVRDKINDTGSSSNITTARSQLLADLGTTSWDSTPGYQNNHLPPSSNDTNRRTLPYRTGVKETERFVKTVKLC